jgi:hypothetical protein
MPRAFLIRLALVVAGLILIGIFLNDWIALALLPAFLFFLWLRIRRGAPPAS